MNVDNAGLNQRLVVQVGLWCLQIIACFSYMEILPRYDIGNESRLHMQHSLAFVIFGQRQVKIFRLLF